jgi:FkbM family methyltransferase
MPKVPVVWKRPAYLPKLTSLGSPKVIDLMLPYVRRHGVVIQAGAHVGLWPAVLSQHFDQVLSFEPVPKLIAAAREGAPYENVTIAEAALSDHCGTVKLSVPGGEKMERFSGSAAVAEEGIEVPTVTIDSLLAHNVGAIMLDIEGHELPALRGAVDTIQKWRPVIVVEENNKSLRYRAPGDVANFLRPFGYSVRRRFMGDLIFVVEHRR